MKQKTVRILYWIFTILFALFMTFSGVLSVLPQSTEAVAYMAALGYPAYLNLILGVAKLLGVIAILQTKFVTIKEWAYAGFTFDVLGAMASYILSGQGVAMAMFVLPSLLLLIGSYSCWKNLKN